MKERRRHLRVDSLNLLAYTVCDQQGNTCEQGMGRTLNVSESGILLETNVELEGDCLASITIAIEENLVDLKGKIIRSLPNADQMFESGIQFAGISDRELEVLKEYIRVFEEGLE